MYYILPRNSKAGPNARTPPWGEIVQETHYVLQFWIQLFVKEKAGLQCSNMRFVMDVSNCQKWRQIYSETKQVWNIG